MSHLVGKPTMWFSNRSDTNRPVQAQKRARSLKFRIEVEEELYIPSSENKGADQLRGHREADLRLCFRLCRLLVFPWGGSYFAKAGILKASKQFMCYYRFKCVLIRNSCNKTIWSYMNVENCRAHFVK